MAVPEECFSTQYISVFFAPRPIPGAAWLSSCVLLVATLSQRLFRSVGGRVGVSDVP